MLAVETNLEERIAELQQLLEVKEDFHLYALNVELRESAHAVYAAAKARGAVDIPSVCATCERRVGTLYKNASKKTISLRLSAHHHDYAKPLDVTYLCGRCHNMAHAANFRELYK